MKLSEIKLGKLNVLDIMIIVVIIFFGGVFAVTHLKDKNDGTVTTANSSVGAKFNYVIEIKALSKTSSDMLKVGDEVYDKVSGTNIGKISNIEIDLKCYMVKESSSQEYVAQFENKDVYYVINSCVEKEEFLEIIKNLKI